MSSKQLKRIFWISGGVLFALGAVGWYDRLIHGHESANYGSLVPWGLWVAAYIYFSGLSAGSFLISTLVYVFDMRRFEKIGRIALFTALVTLFLALLSIWVDLGHMGRAWKVMIYANFGSPMAWMIWLYTLYAVVLVLEMWYVVRADLVQSAGLPGIRGRIYRGMTRWSRDVSRERLSQDRRRVRILATVGVPIAVMFPGGVGALFGVVAARPHWHSGLFPILFLLSALTSGGGLLMVIVAIFQDGLRRNRETVLALGRLVLILLLLDLLFQASELLTAFYGGVPGHVAGLRLVMGGPHWWVFWVWQLGLGGLVPVLLLTLPTRRDPRWASLAGFLVAAGFIGVRLNIVIPGLVPEEIRGLGEAIASPRLMPHYFPGMSEWLVTIGIVGLGLLLFGFGEMLLPRESEEVEHVPV